jgi:hypothetical protein
MVGSEWEEPAGHALLAMVIAEGDRVHIVVVVE